MALDLLTSWKETKKNVTIKLPFTSKEKSPSYGERRYSGVSAIAVLSSGIIIGTWRAPMPVSFKGDEKYQVHVISCRKWQYPKSDIIYIGRTPSFLLIHSDSWHRGNLFSPRKVTAQRWLILNHSLWRSDEGLDSHSCQNPVMGSVSNVDIWAFPLNFQNTAYKRGGTGLKHPLVALSVENGLHWSDAGGALAKVK